MIEVTVSDDNNNDTVKKKGYEITYFNKIVSICANLAVTQYSCLGFTDSSYMSFTI